MGESYYIWLKVPDGDDLKLWREVLIQVLPRCLLARDTPEQGLYAYRVGGGRGRMRGRCAADGCAIPARLNIRV